MELSDHWGFDDYLIHLLNKTFSWSNIDLGNSPVCRHPYHRRVPDIYNETMIKKKANFQHTNYFSFGCLVMIAWSRSIDYVFKSLIISVEFENAMSTMQKWWTNLQAYSAFRIWLIVKHMQIKEPHRKQLNTGTKETLSVVQNWELILSITEWICPPRNVLIRKVKGFTKKHT